MNQKTTISLTLVLWHGHNTRHVVLLLAQLLLGKVSNQVTSFAVVDGQNVKEERLHVVVERLVVQKQFGEQTQVLAVDFVHVAVHFEHRQVVLAVDFRGRRMPPRTLGHVTIQYGTTLHILQAKLAQEQL